MAIQLARRLLTVNEYHRMSEVGILTEEDRVELIHGEIIKMSPIGSKHSGHVKRLNSLFNKKITENIIISVQDPIQLTDFSEPEPDIALLKHKDDFYVSQHPKSEDVLLIIEVADSSIDYDKEVKLPMYALANIPEFWVVNLEKKQIEVFRLPKHGDYAQRLIFYPEDIIDLERFNISISVKDIFIQT